MGYAPTSPNIRYVQFALRFVENNIDKNNKYEYNKLYKNIRRIKWI
ncbi:hypothetical protein FACS189444_0040 [Spirochaetia bacterium]|nr:hypothetical protein FACS189444_0040 [Spirochaetia bacterium]